MKKIDRHTYHSFYMKCKGNQFKNKYVLIEGIHKAKLEQKREKDLTAQVEAKKDKTKKVPEKKEKTEKKDTKKIPAEAKKSS